MVQGLRAGLAVSVAMLVCHLLRRPMGWAALGGFEAILVDNGGPYRSRLVTISTLLAGGAIGCVVASLAASSVALACCAAVIFCFVVTYARVLAQPIASTSVIILVIYFAGVGSAQHTLAGTLGNALDFVLGGAWAAVLSLVLWPVDPFRPARLAVAQCYRHLASFAVEMSWTPPHSEQREAMRLRTHGFQRTMRLLLEQARGALGATQARSPSRTVRAHNLTVLLETADLLFAATLRWTELIERAQGDEAQSRMEQTVQWLGKAAGAVADGLEHRPADGGTSYAPQGSHSMQYLRQREPQTAPKFQEPLAARLAAYLAAERQDATQNIEIAFEAVRALWTGLEPRTARLEPGLSPPGEPTAQWFDPLLSNWTADSVMLRHAARMGLVAGVDVLIMQMLHVRHGSWLAMTSIIVLQPYGSGTLRKSVQRVGGTVAGGVLAAALAAGIHSEAGIIAVITITSIMTLATYAVNYAWYAFFLTPTFVLMSLPHLRDWRFAGVRMGTTVLGAAVALVAMRLLWPEREDAQLGELLGRAVAAEAEYLRAVPRFWASRSARRSEAERTVLAPARRSAGLRILDAEEVLDRIMQEPALRLRKAADEARAEAMTVITYLRRLARTATTLAMAGNEGDRIDARLESLAHRLDGVALVLTGATIENAPIPQMDWVIDDRPLEVGAQQMQRMERQVGVLERSAAVLKPARTPISV